MRIWAIIEMEYDPMITIGSTVFPFVVSDINQPAFII